MLFVTHPAVAAISSAEPIFNDLISVAEELSDLRFDSRKVLGVDTRPPEIWILEIFARVCSRIMRVRFSLTKLGAKLPLAKKL